MPSEDSSPSALVINQDALRNLDLTRIGFDSEARVPRLYLTRLFTEVFLDLSALPQETSLRAIYPAIRALARMIDEDCKQMGQSAPVVIILSPPVQSKADWSQIDSDTELNGGEFMVRLASGSATPFGTSALDPWIADGFEPPGLIEPLQPRSEADYQTALSFNDKTQSPMHAYLLRDCLRPNWAQPTGVVGQIRELVDQLAQPGSAATTP